MQARLHKGAFTQRCVYTQVFLHTNTCTQCFCILLRKHTLTHTHTQWQVLSHTYFYTLMFLISEALFLTHAHTRASSFTEMFLNFKHACFYTEIFATEILLHTGAITNRGSLAKERMCTRSFQIRTFLRRHTSTWLPAADTHFARKSSASRCQFAISPQLLMIETHFVPKGGTSTNKITISPFFNRIKCNSIYAKSSICKKP